MAVTTAELRAILTLQDQMSAQLSRVKGEVQGLSAAVNSAGSSAANGSAGFLKLTSAFAAGQIAAQGLMGVLSTISSKVMAAGQASTDFGQSMANIRAMVPTADFDKFGDSTEKLALRLGKDYPLSASEAGKAIETLVQKGTSLEKINAGAAEAVVKLSSATGGDLVTAAEVVNATLDTFNMTADETNKVTAIMTGAMLNGGMTLNDFKYALTSAGTVVHAMGGNVTDLSIGIAAMAKAGIEGSDAGTSIKSMLMNLQPSTKQQTLLFRELGITTADGGNKFFDAAGKMKSYEEIGNVLAEALDGMSEKQRQATLEIMFGTDGIRAAIVASRVAKGDFGELGNAVRSVDPEEVAKKRLDSLSGSLKQLGGSAETIGIILVGKLGPAMKVIVDTGTELLNKVLNVLDGEEAGKYFSGLADKAFAFGDAVYAAGNRLSEYGAGFKERIGGPLGEAGNVITQVLGSALVGLAALIRGDVEAAVDAFGQAWADALPPIVEAGSKLLSLGETAAKIGMMVLEHIGPTIELLYQHREAVLVVVAAWLAFRGVMTTLSAVSTAATAITALTTAISTLGGLIPAITGAGTALAGAGAGIAGLWGIVSGVVTAAASAVGGAVASVVGALGLPVIAIAALIAAIATFAAAWYFNWGGIQEKTFEAITTIRETIAGWGDALIAVMAGAWASIVETVSGAWDAVVAATTSFASSIVSAVQSAWNAVVSAIQGVFQTLWGVVVAGYEAVFTEPTRAALSQLAADLQELWGAIIALVGRLLTILSTRVSQAWETIVTVVTALGARITAAVTNTWNSVVAAVVGFVTPIISAVTNTWNTVVMIFQTVNQTIVAAVTNTWNGIVAAITGFFAPIIAAVTSTWNAVVATISGFLAPIIAVVTRTWDSIVETVTSLGNRIVATISGFGSMVYEAAASLANNLAAGLKNGINSKVQEIAGAASQMVRSAIDAANSTAQIESPSKVTMETGRMLGAGVAEGIKELTPEVAARMRELIDAATAYTPVAGEIKRVENEIANLRQQAQTDALWRSKEMITIDSEALRLKKEMAEAERALIPIRQDLARATREVEDITRGSLAERQAVIEMDGARKEIRLQIIDLERQLVGMDRDSKKSKNIQEQIEKLRDQDRLLSLEAERIQLTNDVAAIGARIKKEGLEDQVRGHERATDTLRDQLAVLGAEQAVFQALEAIISNALKNEVAERERLIAVFRAEAQPIIERIQAGMAYIDQLEAEGTITKDVADKLREIGRNLNIAADGTKALGNAAETATPQLDAATKKAEEMAAAGAKVAGSYDKAANKVKELGEVIGKVSTPFKDAGENPKARLQKRHDGGPVSMGVPYLVGRDGAEELFVPDASGMILSSSATRGLMDGSSGGSRVGSGGVSREIHLHMEGAQIYGMSDFEQAVQRAIGRGLKRGHFGG